MSLPLASYAAQFGDLIRSARADLDEEDFATWLELAAIAISRAVADELERRWMGEGWSS